MIRNDETATVVCLDDEVLILVDGDLYTSDGAPVDGCKPTTAAPVMMDSAPDAAWDIVDAWSCEGWSLYVAEEAP